MSGTGSARPAKPARARAAGTTTPAPANETVTVEGRKTGGVQSVERALGLLETLAAAGGEMSLTEAAADIGLPVPTTYRLVQTLLASGYVRQLPSRRYALGPRLINLGETASAMLATWARPVLSTLVDELGETANLSTLDGAYATYVAQVASRHPMRLFTEVGRRVRLHSTGAGKALLAQLDDDAIAAIVTRMGLPAVTDHTITTMQALTSEVALIRARGYAMDEGEQDIGVRCVAVPLPGGPGAFAVSVSGPAARMTDTVVARAVPLLQAAARDLVADMNIERSSA